jgi:hypothetical protein
MDGGFELVWFDHLPAFVCDTDTTYCGPSASEYLRGFVACM